MIKSVSRTQSYLEDYDGSWLEFWRTGLSLVSNLTSRIHIICHSWAVLKFSVPYHDYKCIQNAVIYGGYWWYLTGVLEDWVIFGINFDITNNHNMSLLSCMLIFSSLAWLKVHSEHSHTWRTLVIPDWSFGGLDCLQYQTCHHESTFYVILELYANFQLLSVIKSTSRIQSCWEDIDG